MSEITEQLDALADASESVFDTNFYREAARLLRRAEEVLRPFADAAALATDKPQDHRPLRLVIWDRPYKLTLGDLRAAAALLRELEGRKP